MCYEYNCMKISCVVGIYRITINLTPRGGLPQHQTIIIVFGAHSKRF